MKSENTILEEWKSKFQRGFLRIIIFRMFHQLFKTDELLTGNAIREAIEEKTNGSWKPSPGSVYPILSEMESDLIIEERVTGNQKNKEYHLTEFGYNLFDKITEETLAFSPHHQSLKDIHSPEYRARIEKRLSKMSTRVLKHEYEKYKVLIDAMSDLLKQKILEEPQID